MPKKKLNLTWIPTDSVRRSTLNKRRKGLSKKMSEITTLCRVMGSMAIYSPEKEEPVEVWPPNKAEAETVFQEYMQLPEYERNRKNLDMQSLFQQRLARSRDQWTRIEGENRAMQLDVYVLRFMEGEGLHGLTGKDVHDMLNMLEVRTQFLLAAAEVMGKNQTGTMPPPQPIPAVVDESGPPPPPQAESSAAAEARERGKGVVVDDGDAAVTTTRWEGYDFFDGGRFPPPSGGGGGGNNMGDTGARGSGSGWPVIHEFL